MTNSNVSNLLVQVSVVSVEMPDVKQSIPKSNDLFERTLQNAADFKASPDMKRLDDIKPVNNDSIKTASEKLSSAKDNKVSMSDDVNKPSPEDAKKATDVVNDATDKVKEVIKEELDVTDEDIEKAMEALGLAVIDLLNPQSLAELVSEITGQEDSIALCLSDEFKTILDSVTDLTNQIFDETGLTFDKLKEVLAEENAELNPVEFTADVSQLDLASEGIDDNPKESIEAHEPKFDKGEDLIVRDTLKDVPKDAPVNQETDDEPVIEIKVEVEADKTSDKEADNFSKNEFNQRKSFDLNSKPNEAPLIRPDAMVFSEPKPMLQFIPEEQVVTLPTGQTVTAEEIVNQLVEQARVLTDAETTTMEMTLNPEGLGKIFMEVTQKGDEITAKIFTENDAVKHALEAQMANLKLEMNQSSTRVTSIEVSVGAHEFEKNLDEQAREDERQKEQTSQAQKKGHRINLNSLDDLSGLMSEEEMLIAQMMKDNGNTLDYKA